MSIRSLAVILLAVTCGISAAIGVNHLRDPNGPPAPVETTTVLVAKREIPRGSMITADAVETRDFPKDFVPAKAVTNLADAMDRAAIVPLLEGELVVDGKLAPKDAGRGLAALVPKGMRAYTMQTAHLAANVAGFVLPGNRVDVLMTVRNNGANDETGGGSTTTLLQAVEILAVDQRLDAPAENKSDPSDSRSVTVLVTPEQAAVLDLGQNLGMLSLSLRNAEDEESTDLQHATLADLHPVSNKAVPVPAAIEPPPPPEPPQPEKQTVEIRTLRGHHAGRLLVEIIP